MRRTTVRSAWRSFGGGIGMAVACAAVLPALTPSCTQAPGKVDEHASIPVDSGPLERAVRGEVDPDVQTIADAIQANVSQSDIDHLASLRWQDLNADLLLADSAFLRLLDDVAGAFPGAMVWHGPALHVQTGGDQCDGVKTGLGGAIVGISKVVAGSTLGALAVGSGGNVVLLAAAVVIIGNGLGELAASGVSTGISKVVHGLGIARACAAEKPEDAGGDASEVGDASKDEYCASISPPGEALIWNGYACAHCKYHGGGSATTPGGPNEPCAVRGAGGDQISFGYLLEDGGVGRVDFQKVYCEGTFSTDDQGMWVSCGGPFICSCGSGTVEVPLSVTPVQDNQDAICAVCAP